MVIFPNRSSSADEWFYLSQDTHRLTGLAGTDWLAELRESVESNLSLKTMWKKVKTIKMKEARNSQLKTLDVKD